MRLGNLNIEIKSVKTFHAREGLALSCDVFVNGVKTCWYEDRGDGGGGWVHNWSVKDRPMYDALCAEMAKQPKVVSTAFGSTCSWEYGWDDLVNAALEDVERAKLSKKIQKLCSTAIVWGVPGADSFSYVNFKRPLSQVSADTIKSYLPSLKAGEVIFNKNIAVA